MSPEPFLWGTAVSAHQVEGENRHNDWWDFERRFEASGRASDFLSCFEADLDRARWLGTNTFRFSLEWSRVEPVPGQRDPRAVSYYTRLIEACLERGLRPMMTLVQFTLPRWCEGRWFSDETMSAFERHVRWVGQRFGGLVDLFVTFNEPNVQASAGYVAGVFPPGRRLRPDLADRCEIRLLEAHAMAYRALHEEIARHHPTQRPRVGVSPHTVAWRRSRWDPLGLVRRHGERFNWGFLDALDTGRAPFGGRRGVLPQVRETLDFVGLNAFMGMRADVVGALRFAGWSKRPVGPETSDMGWPIDPAGFEDLLLEAHARYGMPLIITENGLADADDSRREAFIEDHTQALGRACAQGVRIEGYYHWSLIDNFEWHEGFGPRFGLFSVDYDTQARSPRPSASLYRQIITEARKEEMDHDDHAHNHRGTQSAGAGGRRRAGGVRDGRSAQPAGRGGVGP